MIILSHRGLWRKADEKNTETAFRRSFDLGFGTETDLRDYCGDLVISHDVATAECMLFSDFLEIYLTYGNSLPLALNIKADGLQYILNEKLREYNISNYFVFDMSVPDGLGYVKAGMRTFTRQSEIEVQPAFYQSAQGVWLDEFNTHWINEDVVSEHIRNNKEICIVSPELHKRDNKSEWLHYKKIDSQLDDEGELMLCTDFPEQAKRVFNEN